MTGHGALAVYVTITERCQYMCWRWGGGGECVCLWGGGCMRDSCLNYARVSIQCLLSIIMRQLVYTTVLV